jgi:hypothetical protein
MRKMKKERKCSLVEKYIVEDMAVFISLDFEHGGQFYGITQLSACVFKFKVSNGKYKGEPIEEEFNRYGQPPQNAIWSESCIARTGICSTDDRIKTAAPIADVRADFTAWLST